MSRIDRLFARIADAQSRHPWRFVLASYLVVALAAPFLMKLELNSEFRALLPTYKPSVQDFERVRGRVGGLSTLAIVLESRDLPAMQRFATDLVPRLERIGPPYVRAVDSSTTVLADFVRENRGLYADLADLEEMRDSLFDRLQYERGRANPFFVQLDDEVPPDPRETIRRIEQRAEARREGSRRHPSGFYVHPNGRMLAVFVRSDVRSGNATQMQRLVDRVEREIAALSPTRYASDLTIGYSGSIIDDREEHQAIQNELTLATSLSVVLVMGLLWIFFRKARSMPLVGFALLVPVLATFGFAQIAVGFLNTSTAFLGSIVVGNGVNPNIIWLARYLEERRKGHDIPTSVRETHANVWQATLAASLAASVAYGSLIVTDFRGFRDFGIIGVVGMILCWLGAVLLLPAATVILDRHKPLVRPDEVGGQAVFGPAIAKLVFRVPRVIIGVSAALSIAAIAATYAWVRHGEPIEYDFRNLRSNSERASDSQRLGRELRRITGGQSKSESNIYIVLDRLEDVRVLRSTLEERRAAGAPWGAVRTLDDLLPTRQEEKLEVLAEIRDLLTQYRRYADESLQQTIDDNMPAEDLRVLTLADIPAETARVYSERDGTRGRIVLVERAAGESIWDGRYLVRWSNALRTIRLPDGTRPPLAGRAPVFADMIETVFVDGPKAVLASLGITMLLVVFTFRTMRERLFTLTALVVGVLWMTAALAALGMRLNFLNFVAFPITCGNGVDYGVNVMKRYALERVHGVDHAVRACIAESGGAVILCSLTTVVGYGTLLISSNAALRSFGLAMTISEITCLVTAVGLMPAMLLRFSGNASR